MNDLELQELAQRIMERQELAQRIMDASLKLAEAFYGFKIGSQDFTIDEYIHLVQCGPIHIELDRINVSVDNECRVGQVAKIRLDISDTSVLVYEAKGVNNTSIAGVYSVIHISTLRPGAWIEQLLTTAQNVAPTDVINFQPVDDSHLFPEE